MLLCVTGYFIVKSLHKFVSCGFNTGGLVKDGSYHEGQLLRRLAGGDASAFREMYDQYQQTIFAFAFYLTKSRDLSEEIVQEVFTRIWEKKEQLPVSMSILPYIKKMTQNLVFDLFRKASREEQLQDTIYESTTSALTLPVDELLEKELRRIYHGSIDQLPPQKKIIYLLSRDHNLSYEEIAKKLNISRNTVRNHMTEALKAVRNYIERHSALLSFLLFPSIVPIF